MTHRGLFQPLLFCNSVILKTSYFSYQKFCCAKIRVLVSVKLPKNILNVSQAMEWYNFPKSDILRLS